MRVWQRLAGEGKLTGPQATFMKQTKPVEELYDTQADAWEVNNLATDPEHRAALERLRRAHLAWVTDICDLGFLPEADLRTRFSGKPPYEAVRKNPSLYPQQRIREAAELAGQTDPDAVGKLAGLLKDSDAAVRYWAILGLTALGPKAHPAADTLSKCLRDVSPNVRLAAAETLCHLGKTDGALQVLMDGLVDDSEWVRLQAANALDRLDDGARPALAAMRRARATPGRYVSSVIDHALEQLRHGGVSRNRER
jgi:uncharacterized sulfatase